MKYKVGDKVIVRSDLSTNKRYYMEGSKLESNCVNLAMMEMCGCVVTIKSIKYGQYTLSEMGYYWTDEMFAGLEEDCFANEELDLELPELFGLLEVDYA